MEIKNTLKQPSKMDCDVPHLSQFITRPDLNVPHFCPSKALKQLQIQHMSHM